mmetsp:Transcript_3694/g.10554  ORF Transcript_3694/g.10554 Transcript_3694/m.10554 type:complete len:146 (-) Transcript_3694:351-788(-)
MAMDLKRQVKVKTGVVKRLRKELAMYEQEKIQNDKRVEDMKASGADTYDVRQAVSGSGSGSGSETFPSSLEPAHHCCGGEAWAERKWESLFNRSMECAFLILSPTSLSFFLCAGEGCRRVGDDDTRLQGEVRGRHRGPPELDGKW